MVLMTKSGMPLNYDSHGYLSLPSILQYETLWQSWQYAQTNPLPERHSRPRWAFLRESRRGVNVSYVRVWGRVYYPLSTCRICLRSGMFHASLGEGIYTRRGADKLPSAA